MCFAMPGVAGDFTRAHAEILGMGVPLVTAESDQRWPGRGPLWWRGLLRDRSNLEYTVDELLHGDTGKMELYLAGEHGLNYYDTFLSPVAMAKRMTEWAT